MTDDYVSREEFARLSGTISDAASRIDGLTEALRGVRAPSKAHLLGGRQNLTGEWSDEYVAGSFLRAVMDAGSRDAEEQAAGKAALAAMAAAYIDSSATAPLAGKAATGTTDATGGWIMPNALVDEITKAGEYGNPYARLVSWRTGVATATVDIPFRSAAPGRAVVAGWGTLKENVDLSYNGYTATLYTLARIHDLGRQFVRHSAGAAEADVMSELRSAFARGMSYYISQGSGSSEPYGFITALQNAPATFTTAHTAATATVAGNMATAIGKAAAALLGRNRRPEAAVISATAYGEMLTSGADTAGFFISGINGPAGLTAFAPGTLVSPWGIPVYVDPDFPTDDLVVAEFSALRVYVGQDFRIDTSEQAGTRWDYNLVGFRGEAEMGLDARPAVYAGAFQYVADVIA